MSRLIFVVCLLIGILLLPAFFATAQDGKLQVVASHGILADVASNVAGDHAQVSTLIPVGSDPHAYIPTPGDLISVAEADLVLLNGVGYEESLLDAIMSAGEEVHTLSVSTCVEIRPFGASMSHGAHGHDDDHADDDHDDEHADDHDDDHADDDHDDDHADDDHDDDHADDHDDEHADDDHDDEHADDDHDDEHADDHDDDHADDHDDDHADDHDDDHADDDHDDDHADDHADHDHADDEDHEGLCDHHAEEVAQLIGADHEQAHFVTLGREQDIDCHEAHHESEGHHHDAGACDPHLWMDPHNVIFWALIIRDSLSELDPDHAASYAANAHSYAMELVALHADFIMPALEDLPEEMRVLIASHESLGYLATTYEFELVSSLLAGMGTAVEPSARDIAGLIDQIREEGVTAIFGDTQVSESVMQTIANDAGVQLFGLYADTLSEADGPAATYLDYMRYNMTTIVDALKGA